MSNHYCCGAAKVFGTEQIVIIKTERGFVDVGDIVLVSAGNDQHLAGVLCTSCVAKGSKDEAVILGNTTVYDVEEIYRRTWEKKEEEKEND